MLLMADLYLKMDPSVFSYFLSQLIDFERFIHHSSFITVIPHMAFFETHRHIEHIAFGIFLL